jgi:hypothetical protein
MPTRIVSAKNRWKFRHFRGGFRDLLASLTMQPVRINVRQAVYVPVRAPIVTSAHPTARVDADQASPSFNCLDLVLAAN